MVCISFPSSSRDRVFYFGSHVIHAAALTVFTNFDIMLRSLNDLEEIVMFLNGMMNSLL